MNGSSRTTRGPQNSQSVEDYWFYVPNNRNWNELPLPSRGLFQTRRFMNLRGRTGEHWALFEERLIRGSNYSLAASGPSPASLPQIRFSHIDDYHQTPSAAAPRHPQILINDYNMYQTAVPPMYNPTTPAEERSKFTEKEQKKALNKLRKQLYSPHLSSIIKRLGTGTSSSSTTNKNAGLDEDGKRCAVCLEDFDSKQFVMVTPCNHMFHEECIVPWVKANGQCPVCRFVIAEQIA